MTQEELAERSGISRPNLVALERGRRECTITTLNRLAYALEISSGTLLDQPPPVKKTARFSRHEIDQIARSLITSNPALPPPLLEIRDGAAFQARPLLEAAGIRRKLRIKKRRLSQDKGLIEQVLARVTRLLPSYIQGEVA